MQPHDEYMRLGNNDEARCKAYRELFRQALTGEDAHKIERAMRQNQPLSDNRFRHRVEQKYGIELGRDSRGRPHKRKD